MTPLLAARDPCRHAVRELERIGTLHDDDVVHG
jgi:hypothetical protein